MDPSLIGVCAAIYLLVAVLTAAYASPTFDNDHLARGLLGALWPLVGALILTCLPFLAIGWLGERLSDWIENHKSKAAN